MKVTVDPKLCIGCYLCSGIAPDVFEMDGDKAKLKKNADLKKDKKAVLEAEESCPVQAIKVSD